MMLPLRMPLIRGMLKRRQSATPLRVIQTASLPNVLAKENLMPPNLETFIPGERLPDVIDVYVDDNLFYKIHDLYSDLGNRFTVRQPIKFVRQYPPCTSVDGVNGSKPSVDMPDRDCPKRKVSMGQLDLRCSKFLGKGHHSKVVLAPLTIPSASSLRRAVAVKFSLPYASREMHLNEAKIYNAFPRNLQAGVAPIVPKFYGYYAPSTEVFDLDGGNGGGDDDLDKETRKAVRKVVRTDLFNTIPPILLIEACGKQVRSRYLSHTDRKDIAKLLKRLHKANFVQGSFYARNILVQPGPLTLPCADRLFTKPSYRIIDFGRGLGFGVNCSSLEDMRTTANVERSGARDQLLIS